ncbi:radical SAM family heme chaperone HemW [Tabrizicola sp. J26]|uniref:radical SAM family heme chaperone HemW n=1 Tax=Alitabrizicola rongguiensis TaxID=2909234 RepID=UPI001F19AD5A|nr:radical SAM family heme chaperone HemW [Tabrizicola rongguiensis]MCF1708205.1 radical SAM family heme chaperone HemW [Tabrizicola rongguiensis]
MKRRARLAKTCTDAKVDLGEVEDWQVGGFAIYVHWPFCLSKCPYCDFNSHVSSQIDQKEWLDAYRLEIDNLAAETPSRSVQSVYFGGGTPSLMLPETVEGVLDGIRRAWPAANDIEITLEANPTSVEAGRLQGYRDAGVNRVSMGIQALNDQDLRKLGRMHTAKEALAAYETARSIFDRVSFDLIYARQGQSLADWRGELSQALDLSPDHLSLYQLTIEEGTVFAERYHKGQLRGLPDEDLAVDLFSATQDLCEAAGLPAYELSNHARPGQESRHNLVYWQGGDYGGVGPGAHGRLTLDGTRYATAQWSNPAAWLQAVRAAGTGQRTREPLSAEDRFAELMMMGLRLRGGIDLDRAARLRGEDLPQRQIHDLIEMGKLQISDGRLAATEEGRLVLNAVLRELLV